MMPFFFGKVANEYAFHNDISMLVNALELTCFIILIYLVAILLDYVIYKTLL
jgi:hypothetical protein